jgi:chorismate mutase
MTLQSFHPTLSHINRPLLIAGPCSAESEQQVLQTALQLKACGAHIIRASAWKPRTRPNAFEGFGVDALQWIQLAQQQTALPFITEVANPKHVEQALKNNVSMLWVGARTTVNPFLVQEIAEALRGVNVPVFVKNPVNPDIDLWIGAIERFMQNGIKKVAAIHRGFSSYENSMYRNKPNWEIPIALRMRMPDVPLICDPSHICGNTTMLHYVSQVAMDLQYDGLMIESHINPAVALSDAKQQVTPAEFQQLIQKLIIRNATVQDAFELSKLEDLRDRIDEIDDTVIETLAQRMHVARQIGKYKDQNNVAILQPQRWEEILRTRIKSGTDKKLSKEFLLRLYSLIHEESIMQQTAQMNKRNTFEEKDN